MELWRIGCLVPDFVLVLPELNLLQFAGAEPLIFFIFQRGLGLRLPKKVQVKLGTTQPVQNRLPVRNFFRNGNKFVLRLAPVPPTLCQKFFVIVRIIKTINSRAVGADPLLIIKIVLVRKCLKNITTN